LSYGIYSIGQDAIDDKILQISGENVIPPTLVPMPDIILWAINSGMSWIALCFKEVVNIQEHLKAFLKYYIIVLEVHCDIYKSSYNLS
jgi:hypothetical protein